MSPSCLVYVTLNFSDMQQYLSSVLQLRYTHEVSFASSFKKNIPIHFFREACQTLKNSSPSMEMNVVRSTNKNLNLKENWKTWYSSRVYLQSSACNIFRDFLKHHSGFQQVIFDFHRLPWTNCHTSCDGSLYSWHSNGAHHRFESFLSPAV